MSDETEPKMIRASELPDEGGGWEAFGNLSVDHIAARLEHERECDAVTMMQGPCNCNRREMERLVRGWSRIADLMERVGTQKVGKALVDGLAEAKRDCVKAGFPQYAPVHANSVYYEVRGEFHQLGDINVGDLAFAGQMLHMKTRNEER